MDPLSLISALLKGMIELNLVKLESPEFSLFRLSDTTVNLGCINAKNMTIQLYLDSPAELLPPKGQSLPPVDGPKSYTTLDTPLFKVDRVFAFNEKLQSDQKSTEINNVPILLSRPVTGLMIRDTELDLDISLNLNDGDLRFAGGNVGPAPMPKTVRVTGGPPGLARILNRAKPSRFGTAYGEDHFAVFPLKAGSSVPIGTDSAQFSKSHYRNVFALCRLDPAFGISSYRLIAIQKDERQ